MQSEITLTAADLSGTGINVNPFMLGRWVNVYSLPHGVSGKMLINKMHVSLNNPTSNTLTLGKTAKALSDFTSKAESANSNLVERVEKVESNAKINEGALGEIKDVAVKQVDFLYASGDSSTKAPEEGWQENAPEWQSEKYIWQKK